MAIFPCMTSFYSGNRWDLDIVATAYGRRTSHGVQAFCGSISPVRRAVLKYNFLILSLLFWIPGVGAYFARPDLRRAMKRSVLCSLPFAFSEFLFYPEYWTPTFLFDLGVRLGFGIEDFLFVSALAASAVRSMGFCAAVLMRLGRRICRRGPEPNESLPFSRQFWCSWSWPGCSRFP